MKYLLQLIFSFMLMRAVEDNGGGGGGAEDRGDDFTPTDDDADDADKAPKAEKAGGGGDEDDVDPEDPDKGSDGKGKKETEGKKDDADEPDEEEEGEEKPEGKDKKPPKKDTRIPVSRHKEILQKEREARADLERKLAVYEGGDKVAATNEKIKGHEDKIEALDKEYTKLITDGDHEKAVEKRREIRKLEAEVVELKSDMKAAAATAQAVEKMRYDVTVERLEAAYPVLNPEHDDHDPDAAQDVMDLAITYRRRGMTPAEAIQKAAKKLLGAETKKQEAAVEVKARVDKEEAAEAAAKDKAEAERKKKQVEKNLDANKRQPADTSKRGADSDKAGGGLSAKDVMKMSQEDFAKLTEDELARMRGDVVA